MNSHPELAAAVELPALKPSEFQEIQHLAQSHFGLDLRSGKEKLVAARLAKHVRAGGFRSYRDYVESVRRDRTGESLVRLIDALSTNHTSFFRELAHFDFLVKHVLPRSTNRDLEIWSAACSSGEEPYSIVMSILEQPAGVQPRSFHVSATDISTKVLETARRGCYPTDRMDGIPAALRAKYLKACTLPAGQFEFTAAVKSHVSFRRLNLIEPVSCWHRPFQLIFCRNVMIYFNRDRQAEVVRKLAECLMPGGYLFVGHSESLSGVAHHLEYVQPSIYRKPGGKR